MKISPLGIDKTRQGYIYTAVLITPFDSVLGKRVLTYWENRVNLDDSQMNVLIVPIENYYLPHIVLQ